MSSSVDPNSPVYIEEGISPEVVAKLRGRLHFTLTILIGINKTHSDGTRR